MLHLTPLFRSFQKKKSTTKELSAGMARKGRELRNILTLLLCTTFITVLNIETMQAQNVSLSYDGSELRTNDPVMFARSLRASSRSNSEVQVLCAVVVFDSEGQHWGTHVSREPAKLDSGGPLDCWTSQLSEILPGRQLGRNDQVLPGGLSINSGHVMAQPAPVTADSPIPPHALAMELDRSHSNLEGLADGLGGYPPQMPRHISNEPNWVAASFLLLPLSEDARETSGDFQSSPVTVLLGPRER